MTILKYFKGAEHPDIALTWTDSSGAIIDLSAGFTFELKIGHGGRPALLTKTLGITGAQTAPNLTIVFAATELDNVPAGMYEVQIRANQTSTNKDRFMHMWFLLNPAVA